jgi:hypothetical protein
VAAVPRWQPEIVWEPETVNTVSMKGVQVTKSLEASPALKKTGGRKFEGPC